MTAAIRCRCASPSCAATTSSSTRVPLRSRKATSKRASAKRSITFTTCDSSVLSLRRNLRRAGTLKNRSRTSTSVPAGCADGRGPSTTPPSTTISAPRAVPMAREAMRSRATEPIDGRASPRKPRLRTAARSSSEAILLVAWRCTARGSSAASMPRPSSRIRTSEIPPPSTSTSIRVAPASRLFSTSSLTSEAGRSTTSPAAIWSTSSEGSSRMGMGPRGRGSPEGPEV